MKFTFSNLPATGWALPAGRIADLARLAEQVGFDRFAIADLPYHYDCMTVMTACLLATERLEVESLVTNPYTRDPGLVAAAWAPDPSLFDKHGTVRPEFVWAALDCPTGFALLEAFGRRKVTLSQLTASLIRPLPVGARWIVMGWPFAAEGRTLLGASAIFSESGELHALASAVLVCAD